MSKTSQKALLKEKFQMIKSDITAEDRKALALQPGISKSLISKYENGNIYDNDKGLRMLQFLKNRIEKRNYHLQNL